MKRSWSWASAPRAPQFFCSVLLWALATAGAQPAAGPAAASGGGEEEFLVPNPNLVLQGVPPIPMKLVERVGAYTEFRGHWFVEWHPVRNEMLVTHRLADASVPQLFRLNEPMGALEQLTSGIEPVMRGSYEPLQGNYLVYQRAPGGSEAFQLYRLDLDGKRAVTGLSSADEASSILGWIPGSASDARPSRLLYLALPLDRTAQGGSRASVNTALWMVDPLQPGAKRKLIDLPGVGWTGGEVSPDGRRVALTQSVSATSSSVWALELATGELQRLLPQQAEETAVVYEAAAFSNDGQRLFVITDKDGEFRQLMAYGLGDRQLQPLQEPLPWDVQSADLSGDGKTLALSVNLDGKNEVRLLDAETLRWLPQPALPGGTVRSLSFKPGSGALAVGVLGQKGPGQIHVLDTAPGASASTMAWTQPHSPAGLDASTFPEQKVIHWTTFDGRTLSGLLSAPPARFTGKRPVLVVVHGGPASQATMGFLNRWNYFIQEMGIAIVEPNVRGSSGYGKTFLTLDDGMRREDSVKDLGTLLDWIARQPELDASRVMVTGGSYGGYMTLAASVHFGDRIAGGMALAAPSNFVTFLASTESYRRDLRRVEYGDERIPEMRDFLEKIAPLNHVDKITKPLFIVHGKNDPRVSHTEAEQIVNRLKEKGQPVWYLRMENEGHGFSRKENGDFFFYASVKFVEEVLLKP